MLVFNCKNKSIKATHMLDYRVAASNGALVWHGQDKACFSGLTGIMHSQITNLQTGKPFKEIRCNMYGEILQYVCLCRCKMGHSSRCDIWGSSERADTSHAWTFNLKTKEKPAKWDSSRSGLTANSLMPDPTFCQFYSRQNFATSQMNCIEEIIRPHWGQGMLFTLYLLFTNL